METEKMLFWKRTWVRRSLVAIATLALLFAAFVWLGLHMDDVLRFRSERASLAHDAMIAKEMETLRSMEMADTYGSTTPEGTVALIISALKSGDIVLASKYYYVLDQDKALRSFQSQLTENGNLDLHVSYLNDVLSGQRDCNDQSCTYSHRYTTQEIETVKVVGTDETVIIPAGESRTKSITLQKNIFTENWKLVVY